MPKRIIILGAAGSIGRQSIEVIRQSAATEDPLVLVGFSVHSNDKVLLSLKNEFPHARSAYTGDVARAPREADWAGPESLAQLLSAVHADIVVNGIAGAAGLPASILVLQNRMNLALANKESIVMGYRLLKQLADENGLSIIPVDSEHAALFQLTQKIGMHAIAELTITASGGPFRILPLEQLAEMTADDACRHPVWKMGRKISIDSATMANKGLELMEASKLFDMPQEHIRVLIHPQSYVHAMVRTFDGALYAQISEPDMRLPIHAALYWPHVYPSPFGNAELAGKILEFFEPERDRYPLVWLARNAMDAGDAACIAYNAANEIAVAHFEAARIRFTQIAQVVSETLEHSWNLPVSSFEDIFDIDTKARQIAEELVEHIAW